MSGIRKLGLSLLVLLGLSGLWSCGSGGGLKPVQTPPPSLELLPGLAELPAALEARLERQASAVVPIDLNLANLRNATLVGGQVLLASSASANSAAFVNVTPSYESKRVPYLAPYTVEFVCSGGEVWLAWSNYKTGRWQVFATPFQAGGHQVDIYLDKDAGGPSGNFACAFISSRGAAATLESLSLGYPDAPPAGQPLEYRQYITAADGVTRLATSIYLPYAETNPLLPDPPYPAVMVRTPYDKAQVDPALISTGTGFNVAVLIQYWRGRLGDSGAWPDSTGEEGLFDDHAGPRHADALDSVAWLEERIWYNGELALTGPSALGLATYQTATALGSRIQGMYTQISAADVANWVMLENGCFGQYNVESFLTNNGFPSVLLTEVQEAYAQDNSAFFSSYDYNLQAAGMAAPAYHETGWWDVDVNETIRSWQAFNTLGAAGAAGQQVLVIGPWTHAGLRGGSAGDLLFPSTGNINDPTVMPSGYDGIQFLLATIGRNPFFAVPASKVCYYMVGPEGDTSGLNNRWLFSASWPPLSLPLALYLDKAAVLSDLPPGMESVELLVADPADPVASVGGGLLPFGPLAAGPLDAAALFAETPGSFLYFSSAAQAADLPVAGDITLTLRVSLDSANSAPADCDIAAWLIDEDGGGNRIVVANGIVRLSDYLEGQGGQSVNLDTPYNVSFSLGSRAYNFAAGHKLVLYVAGSNSPQYAVNPGNGEPLAGGAPSVVQEINLHYGSLGGQCQLNLPVLGPQV